MDKPASPVRPLLDLLQEDIGTRNWEAADKTVECLIRDVTSAAVDKDAEWLEAVWDDVERFYSQNQRLLEKSDGSVGAVRLAGQLRSVVCVLAVAHPIAALPSKDAVVADNLDLITAIGDRETSSADLKAALGIDGQDLADRLQLLHTHSLTRMRKTGFTLMFRLTDEGKKLLSEAPAP